MVNASPESFSDGRPAAAAHRVALAEDLIAAAADIINDVSGLLYPGRAGLCARHGAALVIMHTAARPKQRRQSPELYADVVTDVVEFLRDRMDRAVEAGMPR